MKGIGSGMGKRVLGLIRKLPRPEYTEHLHWDRVSAEPAPPFLLHHCTVLPLFTRPSWSDAIWPWNDVNVLGSALQ